MPTAKAPSIRVKRTVIKGHKQVRGNYTNHSATNDAALNYKIVIIPRVALEGARLYKANRNLTQGRKDAKRTPGAAVVPEKLADRNAIRTVFFSAGLIFNDVDAIQQAHQLFHQGFQ